MNILRALNLQLLKLRFRVDAREFNNALAAYGATTRKSLPTILNQRAYNVAGRAAGYVPLPGGAQSQREKVKAYLRTQYAQRVRVVKSGKNKGKVVKTGRNKLQLQRVHLIAQAVQKKLGRKGLWGGGTVRTSNPGAGKFGRMHQYAGEFVRRAQVGVGFLRAVWLPIVRGLYGFVQYRRIDGPDRHPFKSISQWEGGAARSTVQPAKPGFNAFAELAARVGLRGKRVLGRSQDSKIMSIQRTALQQAFDDESRELMAHTARKLQADADKIAARKAA